MKAGLGEQILAGYAAQFLRSLPQSYKTTKAMKTKLDTQTVSICRRQIGQQKAVVETIGHVDSDDDNNAGDTMQGHVVQSGRFSEAEHIDELLANISMASINQRAKLQEIVKTSNLIIIPQHSARKSTALSELSSFLHRIASGDEEILVDQMASVLNQLLLHTEQVAQEWRKAMRTTKDAVARTSQREDSPHVVSPPEVTSLKESRRQHCRRRSRHDELADTLQQIVLPFREYLYPPDFEEGMCSPRNEDSNDVINIPRDKFQRDPRRRNRKNGLLGRPVLLFNGMGGVIRFAGSTKFANGNLYGIELHEPLGKHNGTIDGVVYFTCQKNNPRISPPLLYGVFVRETQIKKWL
ncbi:hypothetical protein AeRB84_007622 [Aphanomyces euteiches]|nr:hypothetical protein AeRB84_008501 [Aphanomyces euteiches]KAH9148104.1 hypothetical protein AeRB84_008428 [Aphanomyces euteiches]KAH9149241.1 hypothetical protein AeRB84_007622 [Aphanomyces euteiches]